jgi:30S ribosomal protein S31
MGKGDKKTKRGKISKGTFGVRRPHKKVVVTVKKTKPAAKKVAKPVAKPKTKTAPKTTEKAVPKKEAKEAVNTESSKKKEK